MIAMQKTEAKVTFRRCNLLRKNNIVHLFRLQGMKQLTTEKTKSLASG